MNQTPPQTYHVYGRKSYPQPLTLIGQLQADTSIDLKDAALKLAGKNDWVELIAIPEASITPVIRGGSPT